MLKKITTADARKKFAEIVNQVAYGSESFVLEFMGHHTKLIDFSPAIFLDVQEK